VFLSLDLLLLFVGKALVAFIVYLIANVCSQEDFLTIDIDSYYGLPKAPNCF
jgi:hypothetical protein